MPNFESLARKYRFRILGQACRDLKINSLLLAHHEDDQAETVMMRIINGHRMTGILGIKASSEIPECFGMYGVHESGGVPEQAHELVNLDQPVTFTRPSSTKYEFQNHFLAETGGVRIYRPLLDFSKDRLVATCEADKMEWFEDHTNKDPTLTMRNAVRHMYRMHSMPAALTKPALLALVKELNKKVEVQLGVMRSWLTECDITYFDTSTGSVRIQFLDPTQFPKSSFPPLLKDAGLIAAHLLRRIIRLVTPQEHIELSNLHGAVDRIFPELSSQHGMLAPTAFTICGVHFQPLDVATPPKKPGWRLSRQIYKSTPSTRPSICTSCSKGSWSPWELYDGRYWVRVQNKTARPLIIRPLVKDDMAAFLISLSEGERRKVRRLLKERAPGTVRWTLPAIVIRHEDEEEEVLCLPTMDVVTPHSAKLVEWEIRYKKVDTSDLPLAFHNA